jgi:hypothetical protein
MPLAVARRRSLPKPQPEADPRFRKVMDHLKRGAAKTKTHPSAAKKAGEASAAAKGPPNEKAAGAKSNQVDKIKQAPAKKPEKDSFLTLLRSEIQKAMPKTLGETGDFMKGDSAGEMKGSLKGNVNQKKTEAAGPTEGAAKQAPNESGVPAKEVKPIPSEAPPDAPVVNAAEGMPPPKTDSEVSLQDSKQDTDEQMKQAEVTPDQLQKANDPRFSAVLTTKDAVAKQADAAPSAYRVAEKGVLAGASAAAQGAARLGAALMRGIRGGSNSAVLSKQAAAKAKEEQERKDVTDHIEGIYNRTKESVEKKLSALETDTGEIFDKGVDAAVKGMTDYVNERLDAYKDDRYSGLFGGARWLKDKLFGLPSEVKVYYEAGRKVFTLEMDALVVRVASLVETRLKEAKDEVSKGQAEIKTYVQGLKPSLQSVGEAASKEIAGRFQQLEQSIDNKKNDLAQQLAQKYKGSFDKANAALKKIQDENSGLVNKFLDKLAEIYKILTEFKDKLISAFRKGWAVIRLIILHPIRFLGNLLAAIKQGVKQFAQPDRFWVHLKKAFLKWLFGSLAEGGIEVPSDFSLPSILKLVLSVLGITYDRMRAKAVKLVGERGVRLFEKVVEYIRILIQQGPAALWEKVKEDLANLKDMVFDAIKSWLIDTIVKRAVAKLVSMFNPVGAIVQALIMIYDVVIFLIENASKIVDFISAVLNSVEAIAEGAIASAANLIEKALEGAIGLVITLLAQLLGLGGISKKIKEVITNIQNVVDKAIDKALAKIVGVVRKLLGGGKDKTEDKVDPEHEKKVQEGLGAIDAEKVKYLVDGSISKEDAQKIAATVKGRHPVFTSLTVVEHGDDFDFDYVASPGKSYKGAHRRSGLLKVITMRIKDQGKAEKIEEAQISGRDWELAVQSAIVKEVLVPKWEIIIRVPIEIVSRGQKGFKTPSREDLARLKVQRGHQAGGSTRYPEVSMEVKRPGGGGEISQVRAVEITLVEDFSKKGKFSEHKVDQFDATVEILSKKYSPAPVYYYFVTPRPPSDQTKDFIVGTLQSKGITNLKVIWIVVKK